MCKKQTSISRSSTEVEIMSLDAVLRMDGIPALDLWNLVMEVFHSSQNQPVKTKGLKVPNQSSNPDAASSSQAWQRDAQMFISTGKPVATDNDQKSLNHQEIISTGEPVAAETKDVQKIPKLQKIQRIQNPKVEFGHIISEYHHIMLITEKVFSIVRKIYDRKPTDDLNDLNVETAFWCMFVSVTLQAAVFSWARLLTESTIYQESI